MESSSSAFSFCLALPVSVNLDETVTCFGFEEVFLCGSVPCDLHEPSAFSGRAGFDVGASHVSPRGVLAAAMLVRGRGWRWRSWGCSQLWGTVSSLLSGSPHPVRGRACPQLAGVEALRVRLELTLRPLQCVFFLLPTLGFLLQRKRVLKQVGLVCSDHSSTCSLAPMHSTISSFLLLWPPQI